jgi:hypothetical protein
MDTRMTRLASAFLRHQQQRWLRPDAARWVRPDAAKFLRPGTTVSAIYPVLERKYSEDQPRVPAGEPGGGQWTSGSSGSGRPRVIINTNPTDDAGAGGNLSSLPFVLPFGAFDFGDISKEIEKLDLFDLKPRERSRDGVRIAGDPPIQLPEIIVTPDNEPPPIGHNGGPPLDDPPEIPKNKPASGSGMPYVRQVVRWIAIVGRRAPVVSIYLGLLDQIDDLSALTNTIRTAHDRRETYETLRDRAKMGSRPGYERHHIVGQYEQNLKKFGPAKIHGADNLVSIPRLQHIDLSRWYQTKDAADKRFNGMAPRDYLRDKDWDKQFEAGMEEMRRRGIIK